jgi:undecaprenyl-diphosphatase
MESLTALPPQSFELGSAPGAEVDERLIGGAASCGLGESQLEIAPGGFAARLESLELPLVRAATRSAHPPALRALAILLSKLGNGWIYLLLGGLIFANWRLAGVRIIVPAGVNAMLLHSVYPMMKRAFGRRRPFQADPRLPSLLRTLDAHSFPSGHTMTLAGVLTPIVMLWPGSTLPATAVGLGVAWSRIATAHHYPTDVIAGAALGIGVGYPTTTLLVSLWG